MFWAGVGCVSRKTALCPCCWLRLAPIVATAGVNLHVVCALVIAGASDMALAGVLRRKALAGLQKRGLS